MQSGQTGFEISKYILDSISVFFFDSFHILGLTIECTYNFVCYRWRRLSLQKHGKSSKRYTFTFNLVDSISSLTKYLLSYHCISTKCSTYILNFWLYWSIWIKLLFFYNICIHSSFNWHAMQNSLSIHVFVESFFIDLLFTWNSRKIKFNLHWKFNFFSWDF